MNNSGGKLFIGNRRPRITSRNQLLQAKPVEIQDKVLEEIALERIITVAEHSLVLKMLSVVAHLFLDISQLRI